ncbi:MAG: tetratricopeptide repeat protein, partial [Xanthomonadales bacterium]|nr:tetratricopeptide repeat protein [Xanthomonadales bacterium]
MRFRFGVYLFDTGQAQLSGPAGPIALRPMTLKLLQALIEAAPDLVSTDELLDRVWGRQAVAPGVVAQSVRELRKALQDSALQPSYIETRHRLGYRFIAPLQREDSPPSSTELLAADAPTPVAATPRRASRSMAGLGGLALLLTAALLLTWWQPWSDGPTSDSGSFYPIDVVQAGTPADGEAQQWFHQALTALREQRLERASELLDRALAREPHSPALLGTMAAVQAEHGEIARARSLADAALAAAGSLPRAEQLRIEGVTAALYYRWGDAIDRFQAVFQLNPGDVTAGFALFRAQLNAGRGDDAERTLEDLAALPAAILQPTQLSLARARLASLRGRLSDRLALAELALAQSEDPRQAAEARLEQIAAQIALGQPTAARTSLDALNQTLAQTAWPAGEIKQQLLEGHWQREVGKPALALAHYERAAAAAEALGDARSRATARRESAFAQVLLGEVDQAVAVTGEMLAEQGERGDLREQAASLNVRSLAQQRAGDPAAAQVSVERALDLYTQTGDRAGQAGARNSLGMLYARQGRGDEALAQFEEALQVFRATGNRRGAAVALGNIAAAHGSAGRGAAARSANETALAEFRAVDAALDVARLQFNLALQDRRTGALIQAEARLREALDGFRQAQAGARVVVASTTLADLLLQRAEPTEASALLSDIALADVPPEQQASLLAMRGRLAMAIGDYAAAGTALSDAMSLRQQAGLDAWARMSEFELAELDARQQRWTEAELTLRPLRRAMLDDGEALDAANAGALLAAVLQAQQRLADAAGLLDDLEATAAKDALLGLRVDLVRAQQHPADRDAALAEVAQRAREMGFERIALQAERLRPSPAGAEAAAELQRRGLDPGNE